MKISEGNNLMKWSKKISNSKTLYPHLSPRIIFKGETPET